MDPESEGPHSVKVTPVQQVLASCTGAVLTSLMVTPLDVVKIRLQAQNSAFSKGKCFVYSNGLMDHMCVCCEETGSKAWYKKPGNFQGTLDAFLKIIRNEGIKSLWSGLPPTLVMAVPATVIYFTCYDQLSAVLRSKLGENETRIPIIAGIMARFGAVTVISPLELIRTKMQSKKFLTRNYISLSARKYQKMAGFPFGRAGLLLFLETYLSQQYTGITMKF